MLSYHGGGMDFQQFRCSWPRLVVARLGGGYLYVFGGRGLGFLAVARVPSIIRTFWRVAEIKMTFVGFVAESMQIQIRLNRDPQEIFR
jgi:hypothetical protein